MFLIDACCGQCNKMHVVYVEREGWVYRINFFFFFLKPYIGLTSLCSMS
jgi:hypothetical protein